MKISAVVFSALSVFGGLVTGGAQEWELLYEEDFTTPLQTDNAEWTLEDYSKPFDTIMEDNGL